MDGWVTIGTDLDTKKYDQKMSKLERDLKKRETKVEIEAEGIKATESEINSLKYSLEEVERELGEISKDSQRLAELNSKLELTDEEAVESWGLTLSNVSQTESELLAKREQLNSKIELSNAKLLKQNQNLEDAKASVQEINQKIDIAKMERMEKEIKNVGTDLNGIKLNLDGVGTKLSGLAKKAVRWGLAVFGVRSAYLAIRQTMSTLSQYDDDMAADLEYIRWVLANALKPVVEFIIKLAYQLLGILGYLLNRIFGINIFANASVDAFKKQKKALSGSNKEAKQLQKTLAGFDEMNIIQSDKSTKSGGGGGVPSMDLGDVDFSEIDKKFDGWMTKLKNKWKELGKEMEYYLARPELFDKAFGAWGTFVHGVVKIFYGIYEVIDGLIDEVSGVFKIIKGIFTGDTELIKEGLKQLISGAGKILKGIIDIVLGIKETIFGIIKGIFLTIVGWAGDFIKSIGPTLKAGFTDIWNVIKDSAKATYDAISGIFSSLGNVIYNAFSWAWSKIKKLFSAGGKIFDGIKDGIVNAFKKIVNALISGINKIIAKPFDKINGLLNSIRNISILGAKPFKGLWDKNPIPVPKIPKLAKGGIINMPGRGVAVGGERGQEGVIPLTDSQQMALLGEAIGKYITINANITNTMNGRVISRELQKINNENDFAFNR